MHTSCRCIARSGLHGMLHLAPDEISRPRMVHFKIRDVLPSMHSMLDPPRQENYSVLTTGIKSRHLDMGKTIWPTKHLRAGGFKSKHHAGHSMLKFQSTASHLLRCTSTGPLGYGLLPYPSILLEISNNLYTSMKFVRWYISIYSLKKSTWYGRIKLYHETILAMVALFLLLLVAVVVVVGAD